MVQTLRSIQVEVEIALLKLAASLALAILPYRFLLPWTVLAGMSGLGAGFLFAVAGF